MIRFATRPLIVIALTVLVFCWTTPASADALVSVEVRDADGEPADGAVILVRADDSERTCQTKQGRCQIDGVPGGTYQVVFRPNEGASTPPREVMIPPAGRVTLRVASN